MDLKKELHFFFLESVTSSQIRLAIMNKLCDNVSLSYIYIGHPYWFNSLFILILFKVLRHQRGGVPLWISNDHKATAEDIPSCTCGAPRQFEFQVCLIYVGLNGKAIELMPSGVNFVAHFNVFNNTTILHNKGEGFCINF